MPQSLSMIVVHLVFSTQGRAALIDSETRPALHAYLANTCRNQGCDCYRVGGVADHVHIAVRISRTLTIAALVEQLKTSSSKWMKSLGDSLSKFAWQRGYGAFSVSPCDLYALTEYIAHQEEHHLKQTFQEEFRAFLHRYEMHFDERYVWD